MLVRNVFLFIFLFNFKERGSSLRLRVLLVVVPSFRIFTPPKGSGSKSLFFNLGR